METSHILTADVLDIIFDGRNKEYGAYDLRRTYNKRIVVSLAGVGTMIVLLLVAFTLTGRDTINKTLPLTTEIDLADVTKKKDDPPPLPPPPKADPPKVAMTAFTKPLLVKTDVPEDEKPPEQQTLEDTKIGAVNVAGTADVGIIAPPDNAAGKGIIEAPKNTDDNDGIFRRVEIESEYPGGAAAWLRYMNKNLRYPDEAFNNQIQGTVVVQFIVDKEGNVSDIQAVSGPTEGGLREEAIRVIKRSGKWTPAIQNGRQVKSYKNQPITFKMLSE